MKANLLLSAAHPGSTNFFARQFYFLRLPLVVATLKHDTKDVYVYLLICLEERQSQGDPRGNVLACFLVTSCHETRSNTKAAHRAREAVRGPRRSCTAFSETFTIILFNAQGSMIVKRRNSRNFS
jgi:hypothetical protein